MKRHGLWLVLTTSLLVWPSIDVFAQEGEGSPSVREASRGRPDEEAAPLRQRYGDGTIIAWTKTG